MKIESHEQNTGSPIKIADEVWIAAALLHREHPEREDFAIQEVVERLKQENLYGSLRPGVRTHVILHCVANKPPNPGGYIMLYATGKRTRRLYRPGDAVHPRRNGKVMPSREDIPARCHELLDWFEKEYAPSFTPKHPLEAVLALEGTGGEIWQGEDPDQYVRRLREGWE